MVKANTYYYEEGNIQFNLKTDFDEKLSLEGSEEQIAKDVVQLIKTREDKVFLYLLRSKSSWIKFMKISQITM